MSTIISDDSLISSTSSINAAVAAAAVSHTDPVAVDYYGLNNQADPWSKYTKGKKVGEGTYARVFLGEVKETKKPIAIKKIKLGQFREGIHFTAIREIKVLQELNHPNVVELYEVFRYKDNLNLVLEYVDSDLEKIIKDQTLVFQPADVKSWMAMILRGLDHLHTNWVLHRDVKPNNMLIHSSGVLKLADFGLARNFGSPSAEMTTQVVTRWYRAPELLLGSKKYGTGVDMWAVGCTLAELLLRVPFFQADTDIEQLDTIFRVLGTPTDTEWPNLNELLNGFQFQSYVAPPLKTYFTAATSDLLELLSKLLKFNPLHRPTCRHALGMKYFTNDPLPTLPSKLPYPKTSSSGSSAAGTNAGTSNQQPPQPPPSSGAKSLGGVKRLREDDDFSSPGLTPRKLF